MIIEHARRLTAMRGTSDVDVAIAWETVEELQTAKACRNLSTETAFDRYCNANPSAPESRIYDC
ncbi:MAG: CP12 domain-containing protein [Leptolyngbyaceae bacterium]|nr:CP12 domain-containing protein [Leptolyngbyaceae bacterium]